MRELEQFLSTFEAQGLVAAADKHGPGLLPHSLQREMQRLRLKVETSRKKVKIFVEFSDFFLVLPRAQRSMLSQLSSRSVA